MQHYCYLHSQIYNELTTACTYRFVLDQGTQQVVHGSFGAEQPTVSASAFSWETNIGSVWAWGIMTSFLLENRTRVSCGFGGQSFSKKSSYIKRVRLVEQQLGPMPLWAHPLIHWSQSFYRNQYILVHILSAWRQCAAHPACLVWFCWFQSKRDSPSPLSSCTFSLWEALHFCLCYC